MGATLVQYSFGVRRQLGGAFSLGSTGERAGLSDSTNLAAERGPSAFDIRHRAVFTLVDDSPTVARTLYGSSSAT